MVSLSLDQCLLLPLLFSTEKCPGLYTEFIDREAQANVILGMIGQISMILHDRYNPSLLILNVRVSILALAPDPRD